MSNFDDVKRMYEHYGMHRPEGAPHLIPGRDASFRVNALNEELQELVDAYANASLPDIADTLVDLVVFAMGTAVIHDLPWDELFDEVMQANMGKVAGPGVKVRGVGLPDLLKPPDWQPPDIEMVLKGRGWVKK